MTLRPPLVEDAAARIPGADAVIAAVAGRELEVQRRLLGEERDGKDLDPIGQAAAGEICAKQGQVLRLGLEALAGHALEAGHGQGDEADVGPDVDEGSALGAVEAIGQEPVKCGDQLPERR